MAIREKGKGKYQLIVDTKIDGVRVRKTKIVECSGIREARKLYGKFEEELSKPQEDSCTVEALLKDYIEHCEINNESLNTTSNYKSTSKRIISAFKGVKAKELTPYALNQFVMAQSKIYAPKTVHNTIGLLSAAYEYAIKLDLLESNPCTKVDKPKIVKAEKKILDESEAMRFLDCVYQEPLDLRVALLLALCLGLRKSEITGLREGDISTDFNTIRIRHARFNNYVKDAKTDKSQRTLIAPQFVMDEIQSLIEEHHNLGTGDYLIQYCAKPVSHSKLGRDMVRFAEKNDFDIRLHGLRHTLASLLGSSKEIDIAEISKTLGHSNISITLNTYTHVFKNQSAHRVANYMDKWRTLGASENEKTAEAL